MIRAYRAALYLYPRAFRREYGEDMVALLRTQLRDEAGARVVGRAAVDLLATVPVRHLEAHVSRNSTIPATVVLAALGLVLAVVGGPVGLGAGVAALALAALLWSRSRPVVGAGDRRWRALLVAGVGLLVAFIAVTTAIGELPNGGWYVAMLTFVTSLLLIAAGVVLGIAARFRSA